MAWAVRDWAAKGTALLELRPLLRKALSVFTEESYWNGCSAFRIS